MLPPVYSGGRGGGRGGGEGGGQGQGGGRQGGGEGQGGRGGRGGRGINRGGINGRGRDGGHAGGRGRGRGRKEGAQRGPNLTNEIRATLVDHVVNHGLTLREAGLRVQPNLSRYKVASVIRTLRLENRIEGQERRGGRPPMFTEQQEREIVNMVLANNAITLNQLQANIVNNHVGFNNIHQVSTSTLARTLIKNHIQMKQIYRVPFERNSERVKRLRHDYAERVLQMDGEEIQHEFIYVDEAGFNLSRTRRRGRNIIGHRAIVNVPGQRGGNITLCAAIKQNGVLHPHAHMGPYNTALILTFLDQLHNITAANQIDHMQYIVVWDNVSFHRSALVQNWFQQHPHFTVLYLPPYSSFLNPKEEFFSAWRWKVYDLRLPAEVPLIQAMEEACDQMEVAAMRGWIRHLQFFLNA
ncbi:keratin, type I cytoskeletal 9-like [Etheostoma cragini]|uniref:keratin, type I cytoskeletal 9-like n=1 Tax=Etheostoma cragini TaxID=417921 RepID=UPI00155E96C8|nr:keratin, type I cytoskeletal 9-like [Etheostoma cragini]